MFYYIYYGYITGYTCYKIYEYWELARTTYTIGSYTYNTLNGFYHLVKPSEEIDFNGFNDDWDMCEDIFHTKNKID